MVATDPLWLPSLSYDETELRKMDALLAMTDGTAGGSRSGIRPGDTGLAVSLAGTTVNISAGVGSATRSGQGVYRFQLATTSPGTLTAAHATFSRIDLVYVRVWDNSVDSSGLYKADTVYLAGTPSGSPTAPTPGATEIYLPLATITVPSTGGGGTGAATVSSTVRQVTVAPGGILPVTSAADIAVTGKYTGQIRFNTTRSPSGSMEFWTGSAWTAPGDWTAYTPTWTGLTALGSSVSTGRWSRVGNSVDVTAQLNWGTGSTLGSGSIAVSLPATAASGSTRWVGTGYYSDGVNPFKPLAGIVVGGGSSMSLFAIRQSDVGYQPPGSLGYSWVSGSQMVLQIRYEAA
ncbi:hypothetical protein HYE82_03545 [Streptomyces sp. BR123]|uniref:hypothetical protein n=1 Tax=Streptomyces sp. BR123 TaxID=2749828 RepID=UPI0015C430C7|nr:hypothetical protein [Streptomyces sp. BR123]NXY93496.1 hypothetical protein [Streptomyces sp. BR123]